MAIQPIDIQTLYSQLEKISKLQVHQTQGLQVHNAMDEAQKTKHDAEKKATVGEAANLSDGIAHTKERKGSRHRQNLSENAEPEEIACADAQNEEQAAHCIETITDPRLGQHIDVSG